MKLIFIHGRDQQDKDPHQLRQLWIDTFKTGLETQGLTLPENITITLPYYGDLLDSLVRQMTGSEDFKGILARGPYMTNDLNNYYAILSELAGNALITDAEIKAEYEENYQEKGVLNWSWVQAIAKALDRSKRLGGLFVQRFTADVAFYLNQPTARRRINDFVSSAFDNEPTVVVGHSLGSVVGFDVLRTLSKFNIVKYITVGSPLGMNAVRSKLTPPIAMPSCLKQGWYNAYDDRDFVALHPLDSSHFDVLPPIINNAEVKNRTDNRHGIEGYLDDPMVARNIYDALTIKDHKK
jgi:hypothetical protein